MSYLILMEFGGESRVLVNGLSKDGADRLMLEMAEKWARENDAVYTRLDEVTYALDGGIMRATASALPEQQQREDG